MDFSNHVAKAHDSKQHLEDIQANMELYISRYDALMAMVDHVKYDYTVNKGHDDFIKALIETQEGIR